MQDLHIMYGLPSHTSVNPAQCYEREGDTRTNVCCKLFKSLFLTNKEASNKCTSVEEEQKGKKESMSKAHKLLIQ